MRGMDAGHLREVLCAVMKLEEIHQLLKDYKDVGGSKKFFSQLRYPTLPEPIPCEEANQLPENAQRLIHNFYLVAQCGPASDTPTSSQFRIYHVELNTDALRRTDFRKVLEPFYRPYPQGNNLFVFSLARKPYREIAFVSLQRLPVKREEMQHKLKVTIRLRTLRIMREEPYHTDLEILKEIANPPDDPLSIWAKHESAFNVERVTKKFFEEYRSALYRMMEELETSEPEPKQPEGRRAHRFAFSQLLLNRLMVCYFLARKGWMKDNTGNPVRRYFRWLWNRYKEEKQRDPEVSFYDWLRVLFGDAFNNQHGRILSASLPQDICASFQTMPYLNGGLFAVLEPDTYGYRVPDDVFSSLLFGEDPDREPKLLERYNFTVDESRPYDEEMAVDPEMLGKVYESLIAEEERGKAGIFYTPRLEVDMMCRLSIVEYLHQRWNFDRKRLFHFVFSPYDLFVFSRYDPARLQPFSDAEKRALERALKECKVVDPAVGSGSFLVGMLNVLCELLDALAESLKCKRYNRFELKRKLILNNLYGVDVKDWAVRACELRLFLSLLVDVPDEAVVKAKEKAEPILPNLDFRVRVGDSIVQEVPQIPFPIILRKQAAARLPVHAELKKLVEEQKALEKIPPLQLAKKEQEILQKERKIVAQLLESALKQVEGEKEQTLRKLLSASARQRQTLQYRLADLEQLAQQMQNQRKKLHKGEPIPLFLWEVAFPEVFLNSNGNEQGFDIVIMNPPYVRQEKIKPPTPLSPTDYKEAIKRNIEALWGNTVEVPGRADLYVPFFFVGTALLKPKGVLCLVTSNAWLDVDYGKAVQKFLLSSSRWIMTIDNLAKRTFAQSDINTVITLAVRASEGEDVWDNEVRFVAFRIPFDDLSPELFAVAFEEIFEAKERTQKTDYRVTPKTQRELYLEGVEEPEEGEQDQRTMEGVGDLSQLKYVGNKIGGKYLRAPDIFFTILEKGKGKLVRLGDIAEVRRGITTGANEFFYLEPVGMTVAEVAKLSQRNPKAPVKVKNGAGWEGEIEAAFLKPILFSLKEAPFICPHPERFKYCAFVCYFSEIELLYKKYTYALAYIQWGAKYQVKLKHGGKCLLPKVPSLHNRDIWYALPKQQQPDFISNRFIGERFVFLGSGDFLVGDVFFVGHLKQSYYILPIVVALLNSTLTALVADIFARKTYGIGVAYLYGPEINSLLILDPTIFLLSQQSRLLSAFEQMAQREVKSIFEELGFVLCRQRGCKHPEHPYEDVNPEALTLEQVQKASPDRFELDSVVFDVLGLTDEERLQVYQAVAELVKMRLVRARSVEH